MKLTKQNRNGPSVEWATINLLKKYRRNKTFKQLEPDHSAFYSAFQNIDTEYKWPKRPLYQWSRRAEYPFVIESLRELIPGRILDAGSGVTFLPYHLTTHYGWEVECLDSDAGYSTLMNRVCGQIDPTIHIPYHVSDLANESTLFPESYDAVISVSVIEHILPIKRLDALVQLWKLVRPGGKLIITLDIALDESVEGIYITEIQRFLNDLATCTVSLPALQSVPRFLLTPQTPGYSILPVISKDKDLIPAGIKGLYRDVIKRPLPRFGRLACLLISIPKTDKIDRSP